MGAEKDELAGSALAAGGSERRHAKENIFKVGEGGEV